MPTVTGCLLIGFLGGLLEFRQVLDPGQRLFLMIGILGGFTTFSAFSMETLWMLQHGLWMKALLNIMISLVGCLVSVWIGMELGRGLLARFT